MGIFVGGYFGISCVLVGRGGFIKCWRLGILIFVVEE